MTYLYLVCLAGSLVLLVAGIVERRKHDRALDSIPHRVMVNGIRGKSSITRLCAGALRGGELVTVAKTTGTAARFIHPDGSEEPIYRRFGIANVIEQVGVVRRAAAYRPHAMVVECMAVQPDLQEFNQSTLIRSTIGVLCNVREDHLEEMGPTLDDVARSLSRSMPKGGVCVTAERERFHVLEEEAAKRDCVLVYADPEQVSEAELAAFASITFRENVAIALVVAQLLGVEREQAMAGMRAAPPDPGTVTVEQRLVGRDEQATPVAVANLFAANDPESTLLNIETLQGQGLLGRPLHVVINCRPDRIERNRQMGELVGRIRPDRVVVIGEPTRTARTSVPAEWGGPVDEIGGVRPGDELLDGLAAGLTGPSSIVLVGNIHGQGEVLLEALAHCLVPASVPDPLPAEPTAPVPIPAAAITAPIPIVPAEPAQPAQSAQPAPSAQH